MATDATGTPTSPDSIPTLNTSVDAPSGLGTNAQMASIQTALSARIPKSLLTTIGDIIYASGVSTAARLGIGSTGQVLTVTGGVPTWAPTTSTGIIAHGKNTSAVTTTGTTFAGGADLLASTLAFTADGTSDYICRAFAYRWFNNTASATATLSVNLDGADAGLMGVIDVEIGTGSKSVPLSAAGLLVAPSAGAHTVNVRMKVSGGTGTVDAGAGGAGTVLPLVVTIEKVV